MKNKITDSLKKILKDASRKLTGLKRRLYLAGVVKELYNGNARKAERELGWGLKTIEKGFNELSSGLECVSSYNLRGNKKTEERLVNIVIDIQSIVEPESQVDPQFKNSLTYTRITGTKVRNALIEEKGYTDDELPTTRTILNILNREDYSLKRVGKTKPLKKIKEVDAIFDNVHEANKESDNNPESLRIPIDT